MKQIKVILAVFALCLGFCGALVPVSAQAATPQSDVCAALGSNADCSKQPSNGVSINHVLTVLINLFSTVVAIVSVIMIIVGGFKYVTSRGDSTAITSAKNTIIYALIGLVIVAFAQIIVQFVLGKLTAPDCPTGQTLNDKNKCVKVGDIGHMEILQHYASAEKYYNLNY